MYLQTHPGINRIHPYAGNGCKISDYFYWSEQLTRMTFSEKEIEEATQGLISAGHLTTDLAVLEEYEMIVPYALGIPMKEARREAPDYVPRPDEIGILRLDKPGYTHFVPGLYIPWTSKWAYAWDSLGVRPAREHYKITGIRIMRLNMDRLDFAPAALNPLN